MNNTDKLLRAFIEASGYEIEEIVDIKETPISKQSGLNRLTVSTITMARTDLAIDNNGEYKRGDDECYYLKASMEVDYKVTKKEVDYKEVLSKYIDYIECREGTNFLGDADDDDFSTEELKAIRGL